MRGDNIVGMSLGARVALAAGPLGPKAARLLNRVGEGRDPCGKVIFCRVTQGAEMVHHPGPNAPHIDLFYGT